MSSDAFRRRLNPKIPGEKCGQCKVEKAQAGRPPDSDGIHRGPKCGKVFDDTRKSAAEHVARVDREKNGLGAA